MTLHNTNLTKIGAIAIAVATISGAYAARSRAINAQDVPTPAPVTNAPAAPSLPAPAVGEAPQTPNEAEINAILGANAPIARPASQAYAPVLDSDFNAQQAEIEELRAKITTLQAQLNRAPTTLDEQLEQRKIVDELSATQARIRELETTAGQFASYRRFRDMQNGAARGSDADINARRAILAESGLNSNSIADRVGGGSALTFGEAQTLREHKEALAAQYRQYQQTLRALQPGDESLAENLKKEQDAVLAQIKEINQRLVGAPTSPEGAANLPNLANPTVAPVPRPNASLGAVGNASAYGMTTDAAAKMQKVEEAARLLREAGLTQLAGWAANEIPKLADPNYAETPLTLSSATNAADYNPFLQPAKQDLQTINDSISDLKAQIATLTESLANVEVQLRLLSRQAVASPTPAPSNDATQPAPASDGERNETLADPDDLPELNALPDDDTFGGLN